MVDLLKLVQNPIHLFMLIMLAVLFWLIMALIKLLRERDEDIRNIVSEFSTLNAGVEQLITLVQLSLQERLK